MNMRNLVSGLYFAFAGVYGVLAYKHEWPAWGFWLYVGVPLYGVLLYVLTTWLNHLRWVFRRTRIEDPSPILDEFYEDGPIKWMLGQTARDKRLGFEPPCTGSPLCAGAIHIETMGANPGNGTYAEIHLTRDEMDWLRSYAAAAITLFDQRQASVDA